MKIHHALIILLCFIVICALEFIYMGCMSMAEILEVGAPLSISP